MPCSKRLTLAAALVLLVGCGRDPAEDTRPHGPLPRSDNTDHQFRVQLLYFGDADHRISSMTAAGPGPDPLFQPTTVTLTWSSYAWSAVVDFGPSHPAAPTAYDFAITESGATRHETGIVPCYLDDLPTPIDPTFDVTQTSPVTFRWSTANFGSGFEYTVYVFDGGSGARGSVVDQGTLSLALPPRLYNVDGHGYRVDAIRVGGYEPTSPNPCIARALGPAFQVVP
jgi:hypothetical protein